MTTDLVTDVARATALREQARRRAGPGGRFYVISSAVLLLIVLIGFSRTFFLRAFFEVPPVPSRVLLHGVVLTAWFSGLFVQTLLVASGRTPIHRRFGWAVVAAAFMLVAVTGPIILGLAPRQQSLGAVVDARVIRLVWLDLALLAAFGVFFALGVLLRKRAQWHKRLMLFASVAIVSPALGRAWNLIPELRGLNLTLVTAGIVLFFIGLALHDLLKDRRIHPATLGGAAFLMALRTLAPIVAASDFGERFVQGLG
jgi:hypothetical protein